MSDITNQSLKEIIENIKSKKISSLDLTQSYIKNIEGAKKLNTFVTTTFAHGLENAKKFDSNPNFEQTLPGIPLAVKDLFCTENIKTTAGSNILNNFIPSYESTVTKNLWDNGAFLLGKLNCDEFAMGSSNETSFYGNVINQVGGSPANFLDIGGGANADVMAGALEVINNDPNVKSIFINIFGGITRGEEVANGILEAMQRVDIESPIVIRLDGTNADEGRAILEPNLSDALLMEATMLDAAKTAVELAQ